jgi:hypothetical protein
MVQLYFWGRTYKPFFGVSFLWGYSRSTERSHVTKRIRVMHIFTIDMIDTSKIFLPLALYHIYLNLLYHFFILSHK